MTDMNVIDSEREESITHEETGEASIVNRVRKKYGLMLPHHLHGVKRINFELYRREVGLTGAVAVGYGFDLNRSKTFGW